MPMPIPCQYSTRSDKYKERYGDETTKAFHRFCLACNHVYPEKYTEFNSPTSNTEIIICDDCLPAFNSLLEALRGFFRVHQDHKYHNAEDVAFWLCAGGNLPG